MNLKQFLLNLPEYEGFMQFRVKVFVSDFFKLKFEETELETNCYLKLNLLEKFIFMAFVASFLCTDRKNLVTFFLD